MEVKDFKNGFSIFILTLFFGLGTLILVFSILNGIRIKGDIFLYTEWTLYILAILLAIKGFFVNYTPLSVKNGIVSIPAHDQIRTFKDLIIINPLTGLYRRRAYSTSSIQNVANGYTTTSKKNKGRSWNVVISGFENGKSFSQRINVSNKQVRDEVRTVLRGCISGKVNSEFSY